MTAMSRYDALFARLDGGAFVPFVMLGDPDLETSLEIIRTVVAAGADALELGIPFSDPVADGPTIQASHHRALTAGSTVAGCLELVRRVRAEFAELPIGMLVYGNVAYARPDFHAELAAAGADSLLLPDVPVREAAPFVAAADSAGIAPVFIAPARASAQTLDEVARLSRGYVYAISRDGVTGTEREASTVGLAEVVSRLVERGAPPVLLGFGISRPEHVREAIAAGAAGAITGSAITQIIADHLVDGRVADPAALHRELTAYVTAMKAATC